MAEEENGRLPKSTHYILHSRSETYATRYVPLIIILDFQVITACILYYYGIIILQAIEQEVRDAIYSIYDAINLPQLLKIIFKACALAQESKFRRLHIMFAIIFSCCAETINNKACSYVPLEFHVHGCW